jgi:hypothetical protein
LICHVVSPRSERLELEKFVHRSGWRLVISHLVEGGGVVAKPISVAMPQSSAFSSLIVTGGMSVSIWQPR